MSAFIKITATLFLGVCCTCNNLVRAAEEFHVKVRPVSLQIVSPHFESGRPKPLNLEPSLQLGILIESGTFPMATIDGWQTFLTSLSDDTGRKLAHSVVSAAGATHVSSNSHFGTAIFNLKNTPAQGAKTISASGKIAIVFGKKKQSFALTNLNLTVQSLEVPGHTFSITRVSEQMGVLDGNNPSASSFIPLNNICLRAEGETSTWIESIEFFDSSGLAIKAGRGTQRSSDSTVNPTTSFTEREYLLPREIKSATVKITLWTERESQIIPFDFTTGIGL